MSNDKKGTKKRKEIGVVIVEATYRVTPEGKNLFVHIVLRESIKNTVLANFGLSHEQVKIFDREMTEIEQKHGSTIIQMPKTNLILPGR
jgi:hypothetical protein